MISNAKLRDEYARRRSEAIALSKERTYAAYAMLPRLEQIEAERLELAFELGLKLRGTGNKAELAQSFQERIDALHAEKLRILADNGLPVDYLEPEFACAACGDTGYIGDENRMCVCLRERLMAEEYASSGLNPGASFDTFSLVIVKDARQKRLMAKVRELCEEYANHLAYSGARGLMLIGASGLGKTFMLDCVGARAIRDGRSVRKYTAYNIINDTMKCIRAGAETPDYTNCELLIIDDLGSEPQIGNVTCETLFSIINERQNAGKATAIATNLIQADILNLYGERLFSRLMSPSLFNVLLLEGKDLRL